MDRTQLLRGLVDAGGFGLEIGASHAPIFSKADGFNIETLDYADADALKEKYKILGIDTSRIEHVDYISDGRPLHEVIPRRGAYDFIFSSHAIEHVVDIVGYFRSCEQLLKPDGVVALAVPDKRLMFDVLRPVSTTGQALEAHFQARSRHSPAAIYDCIANFALLGDRQTWSKHDLGAISLSNTPPLAKICFDEAMRPNAPYQDVHGWVFTPNSFRLILSDLKDLNILKLAETQLLEADGVEFYVALSMNAASHRLSRPDLQRNILREQTLSGIQMLAAEDETMEKCRRYLLRLNEGKRHTPRTFFSTAAALLAKVRSRSGHTPKR